VAQVSPCLFRENQLKSKIDIPLAVTSGLNVSYPDVLPIRAMMDFKTLLKKHQALLAENQALKEENLALKARLGLAELPEKRSSQEGVHQDASPSEPSFHLKDKANPTEKIRLFMSLFKGRDDLYAKRWESREGGSGYAPVCLNEWKPGFFRQA
jgi:regulator of replication initiation timing